VDSEPDLPEATQTPPPRTPAARVTNTPKKTASTPRKPATPRQPRSTASTTGATPADPAKPAAPKAAAKTTTPRTSSTRATTPRTTTPRSTTPKSATAKPAADKSVAAPNAEKPPVKRPVRKPATKTTDVTEPEATTPSTTAAAESPNPPAAKQSVAKVPAKRPVRRPATKKPVVAEPVVVDPVAVEKVDADATATVEASPDAITAEPVVTEAAIESSVIETPDVAETPDLAESNTEPETAVAVVEKPVVAEPAVAEPIENLRVIETDAAGNEIVLKITGLVKRFDDKTAVAGIDLQIAAGSFFGIVGPNGAGKTTTLSMVTGLLKPDAGRITVHGADVWANPVVAKRTMGVLPDRLRLFDRLTGSQLLYYSGILHGLDKNVVRSRSADLAAAFGLEDSLDRLVTDYSAGMTKKIAIAAAMIHSPRLLVLDEPFESVDPVSAANVIEILQKYVAAGGTVVMSSHTMNLIERICDSVAVVVNGAVLATGTMDEVRGDKSLEDRFVELAGGRKAAEGMEWLHKFSD